ncbi:MAG: NAD(P)-dependent oxidoreductase [Sterolibacterium sp.]|jgi:nucleoside-diphosphate-sugar epimerase
MFTHLNSSPKKPERVVILGARGFIGAALKHQLEAQDVPTLALNSADVNLADAGAAEALAILIKPSDTVVMLAALTPDKGRDTPTLMKNLAMMQSVCAALVRSGCAQFVYFSSDAVYNPSTSLVTENTPASPQDLYGAMHYMREIMARNLGRVPLLILRPTLVYGLDDTHNAYGPNRFRRAAQQDGKITLFGSGEEARDHIYVDDVAALTIHCILRKSIGTLIIATGVSKSFREIAEMVAEQFGDRIEITTTPRANPITHRHYDVTALIKAFPDFRVVAVEEGTARERKYASGET